MKYSHLSESLNLKKISEKNNIGIFHIEGLYPGYGLTLGNALRRTLLSSLPGAAITQVKIKGVSHEFSTLEGMVEDIVELTLNLKKVRFHFFAEEPQVLKLYAKGEKEVTANDIEKTTLVEVVNPSLHLATLTSKNAQLDMELVVEKGLGYSPVESRHLERLSIGTIVLDAIFSPIVRANFKVENMRVGERTDYNRLILEIETDGSIAPSEALHKAAHILQDHFNKIAGEKIEETNIYVLKAAEEKEEKTGRKKKKMK